MAKIITTAGNEIDFEAAVMLMDDEIRETLHDCESETEQAFFDAYCAAHFAKYAEHFKVM